MILGIYTNTKRDTNASTCKELAKIFVAKNIPHMISDTAKDFFVDTQTYSISEIAEKCDIVFVLGGDGTMLEVVRHTAKKDALLIGINMGRLGFLTEVSKNELASVVESVLKGDYTVEKRAMLKATFQKDNKEQTCYALNEIILSRITNVEVITINIEIDSTTADNIRGDGVMVATPTGSTAYSLSCNGPILSPTVEAFIINMICPHTLHSTPIVISDNSFVVLKTKNRDTRIIADSQIISTFDNGACVKIEKSPYYASFIRLKHENFYHRLLKKLSYWGD
ncbi:MAG: NAD(+)/NADH kinase [Clostridia bacterium]